MNGLIRSTFLAIPLLIIVSAAQGAVLTMKISAINKPEAGKQKTVVEALLPPQVKPGDIIDKGELELVYDVAAKAYRVRKEVELNPGESRLWEVKIKDIFVISDDDLKTLSSHAGKLADALKESDKHDTAKGLRGLVDEGVRDVVSRQTAFAVGAVKPADHIRAYETNLEALNRVRKDLGVLENLVIADGKDPGAILGAPKVPPPVDDRLSVSGRVFTIHIKVTNPSLTTKSNEPLRHEFPVEVKTTDITDAGGLKIAFDTARNVTYAYLEAVELAPQENKVFDVKVRDPWGGLADKLARTEKRANNVLVATKELDSYKSTEQAAKKILEDIKLLNAEKKPATINDDYVVFSRRQAEAARDLEAKVQRLEEVLQPSEKPLGIDVPVVPRPNKQTTWIIIYIVLGFLGLFSVLFFLRWFGKGASEKTGSREKGKGEQP